jgi:hypothetical protein
MVWSVDYTLPLQKLPQYYLNFKKHTFLCISSFIISLKHKFKSAIFVKLKILNIEKKTHLKLILFLRPNRGT